MGHRKGKVRKGTGKSFSCCTGGVQACTKEEMDRRKFRKRIRQVFCKRKLPAIKAKEGVKELGEKKVRMVESNRQRQKHESKE